MDSVFQLTASNTSKKKNCKVDDCDFEILMLPNSVFYWG